MATRDHFRVDVLVRVAAQLDSVDVEPAEIERPLHLDEAGAAAPARAGSPTRDPRAQDEVRHAPVAAGIVSAGLARRGAASCGDRRRRRPTASHAPTTTPLPPSCPTAAPGRQPRRRRRPRPPSAPVDPPGPARPHGARAAARGRGSRGRPAKAREAVRPSRNRQARRDAKPRRAATPRRPSAGPAGRPRRDAALAAIPAVARAGVPSYFIDSFRIPVFLLPIFQAAGTEYGVRWEILAAINEIETDYGRNLNVSTAGATGWMQFMPATWAATASTPTATEAPTRTTRSTRSSPRRATCRPRARRPTCAGDLRLQPRRLVRRPPSSSARNGSPRCRPTSSAR